MAVPNWSLSDIKLFGLVWLTIQGKLTPYILDIVNASVSWGLNTIPRARITVAAGRELKSLQPSNIHNLVDYLKMQLPFQLYMVAQEKGNSYGIPVEQWPANQQPFLIFDGYTANAGFAKSMSGDVNYTLTLTHWLTNMNFSSCLSRTTNTFNPAQFAKSAAIRGGFGVTNSFVASTLGNTFFTTANIRQDFWGSALLPWLQRVCTQDILTDSKDPLLQNPAGKLNYEATRALQLFEPIVRNGVPTYIYGVPLSLDVNAPLAGSIITAISANISKTTGEAMASTTLWDKLVGNMGFAGSYLFSVVPLVRSALVVPFQPGLRAVWQTIYAQEYDSIGLEGDTPRALRGVRIFGGFGDSYGLGGARVGTAADQTSIGGAYTNPNMTDGMIRYFNAVSWMSSIVSPNVYGTQAMQPAGVIGNALFPGNGQPLVGPRPGLVRQQVQPLLNQFAQAVYVNEVLQDRSGVIKSKLRFDIGPGSSVQIMINEEPFVDRALGLGGRNSLFGSVRSLTHYFDAESADAYTVFDIGWLRSPLENTQDGTSVIGHPLWQNQWVGSPNVEGFLPNQQLPLQLGWTAG
jgi:hypothetical protein